jgi:alpha-1,3-mannosyltransferase
MSKRLHSIYVLRLFNDPIAMGVMTMATLALCKRQFTLANILFSLALSIKMNILLFLPAVRIPYLFSYSCLCLYYQCRCFNIISGD